MPARRSSTRHRTLAALVGASLSAVSGPAAADIYRRVDPDGTIVFTSRPQPGATLVYRDRPRPRVLPAVMPSDTSPERFTRYDAHIREAAALYQIPEALIRAVIRVESDFDPRAVSRAGARGLMQLMPATATRMLVSDSFDPRQNIFGGTRYLRILANLFNGDLTLTVAAYNAGEGAVARHGGVPPYDETQMYVAKVKAYYQHYRARL